jgi:integrase
MLGLRIGEALALQWHDFDEKTNTVAIQRNWSNGHIETPKTEKSATVLPVSKTLIKLIRSWHKKQTASGYSTRADLLAVSIMQAHTIESAKSRGNRSGAASYRLAHITTLLPVMARRCENLVRCQ